MNRSSTPRGRSPGAALLFVAAGVLLSSVAGCAGPPEDRSEARERVEAVAESLRAEHQREFGVATPEELRRIREERADTASADER